MILIGIVFGWLFCFGGLIAVVGLVLVVYGLLETEKPKAGLQVARPMGPSGTTNFCPHCGTPTAPNAVVCNGCGRRLP